MTIYDYHDYKLYFNDRVEALPKKGRGEFSRIAEALSVSTTMVSQVFRGDKHLSLELAIELCEYMELGEEESEYFLLLVELGRAGSFKLQEKLRRQLIKRQEQARRLDLRVGKDVELSSDAKSIFYSNWIYSGIRNLTAIDSTSDINSIASHLGLPIHQVQKIVSFLLEQKLCLEEAGQLRAGPARTYVSSSSPLVSLHHKNWRIKGFQEMLIGNEEHFFFTSPMSLSKEAALEIRQRLPDFIEEVTKLVVASDSQTVRCLNIDWFGY